MTDIVRPDESNPAEESEPVQASTANQKRDAGRAKQIARKILVWIPLILLVLWTVTPFLVTMSVSFKQRAEVFADPGIIPSNPTFDAYSEVLASESFTTSFVNSLIVGAGTTVLSIVIGCPLPMRLRDSDSGVGTFCSYSLCCLGWYPAWG